MVSAMYAQVNEQFPFTIVLSSRFVHSSVRSNSNARRWKMVIRR